MTEAMFAALVWQVIDWLRELSNFRAQKSAVITQALAWAGGIVAVVLGAHAGTVADHITLGLNTTLAKLDGWSQVLVGLLVSSLASTGVDVKQAFDNTDTSSKPPLIHQ